MTIEYGADQPHVPSTEDVRRDYAAMRDAHYYAPTAAKARVYRASGGGAGEFDRWLAEHDREVILTAKSAAVVAAFGKMPDRVWDDFEPEKGDTPA